MLFSVGTALGLTRVKGILEKGRLEGGDVMSHSNGRVFHTIEQHGKSGYGGRVCVCFTIIRNNGCV